MRTETEIDKNIKLLSSIVKSQKERHADVISTLTTDDDFQRQQEKIFKPVVDITKLTNETLGVSKNDVVSKLKAIEQGVSRNTSKTDDVLNTIALEAQKNAQVAIQGIPAPVTNSFTLGLLPQKYLPQCQNDSMGLKYDVSSKHFMLGNSPVTFNGDDVIVNGTKHNCDEGLWELLTKTDFEVRDDGKYKYINQGNLDRYLKLIIDETKACFTSDGRRRSSTNNKYRYFIKPELDKRDQKRNRSASESDMDSTATNVSVIGLGLNFIPDTPKYLINRLYTLLGHKKAGHTIELSEASHILDMLRKRKKISKEVYKNIYSYLNC